MNVLLKATHALVKLGKYDSRVKKSVIKQANRNSNGFFTSHVKNAIQKNSMLAANRISVAHQHAITEIYGDQAIQMIGKVVVE